MFKKDDHKTIQQIAKHNKNKPTKTKPTISSAWDRYLNIIGERGQTLAYQSYLQRERLALSKADPRSYQKPKPRP